LPDWLGDLSRRAESITHLPADQSQIERCVLAASRAAKEGAAA
jgi:threonine synthase